MRLFLQKTISMNTFVDLLQMYLSQEFHIRFLQEATFLFAMTFSSSFIVYLIS